MPDTGTATGATSAGSPGGDALSYTAISDLYMKNCSVCHGKNMEGRPGMAPELMHEKKYWKTADELAKYLLDPQGYADKDPRLSKQKGEFSMKMPAIPTMSDADRLAMAKWVIER